MPETTIDPGEVFRELRSHCLAKPDAIEDYPWGDVAWKVKSKAFAFGGEGSCHVTVKSTVEKQASLILHPRIKVAAYVGRYGWVSIEVDSLETLAIAKDLVDESYELVSRRAGKR